MTFVLNILHDEYSLLAADRQANVEGPSTVTVGGTTIRSSTGIKIEGFHKMKVSKCGAVAVGVAGSVREHPYFESFDKIEGVNNAVKTILDAIQSVFLACTPKTPAF
jgi:hypothetical protein